MAATADIRPGTAARSAWKVQTLAEHWQISAKTIYGLIAEGRLRAVRAGKHYLIPDESVAAFLASEDAA